MNSLYRSLIVDDNPLIVEQLTNFLAQTGLFDKPTISNTGMEAIVRLRDQEFDLLFLDMELPDLSGLDLLRLFPSHCPVIAVSAYPSYAVDCYDSDIADFMSKPLTYTRFLRALRRTVLKTVPQLPTVADQPSASSPAEPTQPEAISLTNYSSLPTYIFLKTGRKTERFIVKEIVYFNAYALYAKLITTTGTCVINESLASLTKLLNPDFFLRVHKSYLINLIHVSQYSTNTLWLNTHKIPVGETYKNRVQKRLKAMTQLES